MKLLIVFAAAVLYIKYGVPYFVNSLTFHPKKDGNWNISTIPWPVEEHWISASDNTRLQTWYFPKKGADTVLLWLHGNGSNISGRAEDAISLVKNLPINLLLLSYRGYGKSEGSPSEAGVYKDALAAYELAIKMPGISNVVLYGKSLGGAVAIELASKVKPTAMIIECSFTSLVEIGKVHYPLLPGKFLAGKSFKSIAKVGGIDCPKLFIHGEQDEVVPIELGKKLFEAAKEPKEFYSIKDGDHANLMKIAGEEYFEKLRNFIADALHSHSK